VTAVRPPIFPPSRPAQPAPRRADAAKLAAQKAFFEAALGKTAAPPAAPVAASASAPAAGRTSPTAPTAAPETPAKLLRPGSLLDIRI
jgi:hypothetical protein